MLLMAAAYAGRGLGSCAASPLRTSATNQGVVESGTVAAKLAAGAPSAIDSGTPADHDGSLEPGEAGVARVTVANGGVVAAEQLTLTATSSNPGVRIGAPRSLALLPAFASTELTVPVSVLSTVSRGTSVTLTLHIAADDTCDRAGITTSLTFVVGGAPTATEADRVAALGAPAQPGLVAIHAAPATSLRAFDDAVCIAEDVP